MNRFTIIILTAIASVIWSVAPSYGSPVSIRFSHVVSEDTPKGRAAKMFAKLANERLKGKVRVTVYPDSQLYDDEKAMHALISGNLEMAAPSTAKFTELIPEFQLFDLPFLFKNRMVLYSAIDGNVGKRIFGFLESKGLAGLSMWDNGFKQLSNNRNEIRLPKDAAGLAFRIMPSDVIKAQFEYIGAKTKEFPFSFVRFALETGAVDGQENTWSNMYSKDFHKIQKHITASDHGYLGYVVVMNAKFWKSLPKDTRAELKKILKDVTLWLRRHAFQINHEAKSKIMAAGTTHVTELSPEEIEVWRKTYKPFYNKFKDIVGSENLFEVFRLNSKR